MDVAALKQQLISDEGNVGHAYPDSEGYLTIGVGHMVDQRLGGKLDDDVIDRQLMNDILSVENDLMKFSWWDTLSPVRQVALASMRFQLGPIRFRGFHQMLAAIEAEDFDAAADHVMASMYAKQVPNRAKRISDQLRKG